MTLNEDYYKQLWEKFERIKPISKTHTSKSIDLNIKLLLENFQLGNHIHINFQNSKNRLYEIGKNLFIELANDIYLNHYDLPKSFVTGDIVKNLKSNIYYKIVQLPNNLYLLVGIKSRGADTYVQNVTYDYLVKKKYILVEAGVSEKTIKDCFDFFEKLNSEKIDFPRINFDKKVVFIAKKTLWDTIAEKSKIPAIYLPNPRDEDIKSETRSIPALKSCTVYFTPKYEVCYQQLLQKGEKIKTIVIFDTEADKLSQIMQDQQRFKFNVLVLSNSNTPSKSQLIPCWNWFKEELEIIDAL